MRAFDRFLNKNTGENSALIRINVNEIAAAPYQPRKEFDEIELRDLAMSIQEVGLIQPITVRKTKEGYELIAGERRLRACKMAGIVEIPAIVSQANDEQSAVIGLIENIQRKELNYFEEAFAYARLIGEFGYTQEEVAGRVAKSQSAVANKIRLLRLSDEVRQAISTDVLSERHARALLKLEDKEQQLQIISEIVENNLNVRETEELIDQLLQNISREITKAKGRNITSFVRDVRIFVNTFKETAKRAKQNGLNIEINEMDDEEEYRITVIVPKKGNTK